ncbi:MAG TPA: reverse transcriptase domain-containing protein [Burkholderiaceae bacterium]|nr:reverse transcriptase domain-containing protein [Burkholderiaceae bacterium]
MYSSDCTTGLFRVGEVDEAAQDQLLQHLQRRLSPELRDAVDATAEGGAMQETELLAALGQCATGKAPGTDGIPYEVYKALWPVLGQWLLAATNAAFADAQAAAQLPHAAVQIMAALPQSWREGIIALIYKGRRLPREALESHRPITLLNSDYKLVGKVFSNRLQPALAELIDNLQTAFLCGRDPRHNVVFLQSMLEWLASSGQQGALLLLDIEKAYDRVHRQWVLKVAQAMGFGPHTLVWMQLFLAEGRASVVVNGHQSVWFPVRNGLQQGSTLSPVLWTISLEPLTAYCHHLVCSGALHTPSLPDGTPAPPVSHHADDTHLLVTDADVDGPVVNEALALFCRASNARIHPHKSKGLVFGAHRPIVGPHPPTGAEFIDPASRDPPRHLGVPITADLQLAAELCYEARRARLKGIALRWRQHGLSMVGRVHIAKQVLGNALAYHFSFVPLTPDQLHRLQLVMDDFAAWSLLPEDVSLAGQGHVRLLPTRLVACLSRAEGGIGHVDLQAASSALMAKTIAQLAQPGRRAWQRLLRGMLAHWAPAGTQGWGWIYGTCPIPDHLPPRIKAAVVAFRATNPQRFCMEPARDDPRAVLVEPLFYNRRLCDPATAQPFAAPADLPPGSPCMVGQLRAAPPAVQQLPHWTAVVAAMPDDWKVAIPPDPVTGPWPAEEGQSWRLAPGHDWAVSPEGQLHTVTETGRALPASQGAPAPDDHATWPVACVLACRKPMALWTPAERVAYRAAPASEKAVAWPREWQVVGPWEGLQCYPAAHGHGQLSLLDYEVRNTRQLLTTQRALDMLGEGQVPVTPAAWPRLATDDAGPSAPSSALTDFEQDWVHQLQARRQQTTLPTPLWMRSGEDPARVVSRQQRTERHRHRGMAGRGPTLGAGSTEGNVGGLAGASVAASGAAASLPSALGPQQPHAEPVGDSGGPAAVARDFEEAPGPESPAAGTAAGTPSGGPASGPAEAPGAAPGPSAALSLVPLPPVSPTAAGTAIPAPTVERMRAWKRLWDCPAGNRAKVLGWRLAHARLPCGLYMAAKLGPARGGLTSRHLCPALSCAQQPGRTRARDSLTHVFLTCPALAPARHWFAQLWVALTNGPPPPTDDAALMLGDLPAAWSHHPARTDGEHAGIVRLWGAVRLSFLFAVWCARQAADAEDRTAQAVVRSTVLELQRRMREQFYTSAMPAEIVDALPARLLTANLQQAKLADFTCVWAHRGVLCSVVQPAGDGPPALHLKLSMVQPVPAP